MRQHVKEVEDSNSDYDFTKDLRSNLAVEGRLPEL